nr:hypothetical protein [Tanacetum cinerariifolium]
MPQLGFSTLPQTPNNTTSERSPMITIVFATTTPENTPFAYRGSTSTNPNPMISPAFVEANYEQEKWRPMELLMIEGETLKDQENPIGTIIVDRQIEIVSRDKTSSKGASEIRTTGSPGKKSKKEREEREMEPRPEPNREATTTLWPRSPVVCRQRERIMGFEEALKREGGRRGRNAEGIRPSKIEAKNKGVNISPLLAAYLGRNESGQPLRSSLTFVQ